MVKNNSDPVGYVHSYIAKNYHEIYSVFAGEPKKTIESRGLNADIFKVKTQTVLLTCKAKYDLRIGETYVEGPEEYDFFAKYYRDIDVRLPKGFLDERKSQYQLDKETYALCQQFDYIPWPFLEFPKGKIIILDYIKGEDLEKILEKKDEDGKTELAKKALGFGAKFHVDLKNRVANLIGTEGYEPYKGLTKHFQREDETPSEQGSINKALGYLRAIKGLDSIEELNALDESLKDRFRQSYLPIARAYNRGISKYQLRHGDLTPTNIMVEENGGDGEKKFWLIDPKINFGQAILDVAEFITSLGIEPNPQRWNELVMSYWRSEASAWGYDLEEILKAKAERPAERLISKPLGTIFDIFGIEKREKPIKTEEVAIVSFGAFYRGIVHESLKKIAKNRDTERFLPELYEEWYRNRPSFRESNQQLKVNIKNALDTLINNPQEYDVSKEHEVRPLIDLRRILFGEGWIEIDDLKPQLKEKHYRKTFQNNPSNPGTFNSGIEAKSGRFSEPRIV